MTIERTKGAMKTSTNRSSITLTKTKNTNSRFAALTPRGRDVLNGILSGNSNKMIAHTLGISPRTVEVHRARMMRDLGARHVADAIRLAFEAMGFRQHGG
jgi:FixJ family two-component response regulator